MIRNGVFATSTISATRHKHNLLLADIAPMPANNMILIFECEQADTI